MPAPGAVNPGRRGWDALGSHLRDKVVVQSELPARARLRDGLGVRRRLQNKGCTRNRAVEVPEGRQNGLRRLPGPAQKVPVRQKGLEGQYRIPRIEAECMCNIDTWKVAEDPVLHCLEGGSLLLTGYRAPGKPTWRARS